MTDHTPGTPDPVDATALRDWMSDHEQVPEQVVSWGPNGKNPPRPRWLDCAAHGEGQHCCLDYFYDTIMELLDHE